MFPSCAVYEVAQERLPKFVKSHCASLVTVTRRLNVSFMCQYSKWHTAGCQYFFLMFPSCGSWASGTYSIAKRVFHKYIIICGKVYEFSTALWISPWHCGILNCYNLWGFGDFGLTFDTLRPKITIKTTINLLYLRHLIVLFKCYLVSF